MTQISNSHRIAFQAWYCSKPEIIKAMEDDGVNVLEFFTDESGQDHYCFEETRDALVEWLKENPEADRDIRKEFVEEFAACIKIRRDITLYGYFPGMGMPEPKRNETLERIYMSGVQDAGNMTISMTDDRTLNGARWRLTTAEGTIVPFCNPKDEAYLDTPGLIVMFNEAVNK